MLKRAGLGLLLALLASCAGKKAPVAAPEPDTESAEPEPAPPKILGTYRCKLELAESPLEGACQLEGARGDLRLRFESRNAALRGRIQTTSYGFQLEGKMQSKLPACQGAARGEFFRQGGGGFASVLLVGDACRAVVTLHPSRQAPVPTEQVSTGN